MYVADRGHYLLRIRPRLTPISYTFNVPTVPTSYAKFVPALPLDTRHLMSSPGRSGQTKAPRTIPRQTETDTTTTQSRGHLTSISQSPLKSSETYGLYQCDRRTSSIGVVGQSPSKAPERSRSNGCPSGLRNVQGVLNGSNSSVWAVNEWKFQRSSQVTAVR